MQAYQTLGYAQVSGLSAATGLTVPAGTTAIEIVPQTQAVRWRDDGVNPSATVGNPIAVGQLYTYKGDSAARLKFFEQAASAVINVQFWGGGPT